MTRPRNGCTCPHEEQSLGRLDGISMGRGIVRTATTKGCPVHDSCQHYERGSGKWCPIHEGKGCPYQQKVITW